MSEFKYYRLNCEQSFAKKSPNTNRDVAAGMPAEVECHTFTLLTSCLFSIMFPFKTGKAVSSVKTKIYFMLQYSTLIAFKYFLCLTRVCSKFPFCKINVPQNVEYFVFRAFKFCRFLNCNFVPQGNEIRYNGLKWT